ncbi:hypothetical protein BZA77DRAFT_93335 [Pyronema omphalodes]|nr:hypothetical protein BZA77DRAFT_93335 [Pyronema omphalodes]
MSDRDESKDILLSGALRKAVAQTFAKDRDTVTLRYIRTIVEQEHKLGADYFKTDPYWKERSKEIIMEEVDIQTANNPDPDLSSSPIPVATSKGTTSIVKAVIKAPKSKPQPAPKKKAIIAKKTASNVRGKAVPSDDEDEEEDEDKDDNKEDEDKPKSKTKAKAAKPKEKPQPKAKANGVKKKETGDVEMANTTKKDDDDDSVLSDLPSEVEEEVAPKKRGRPKKTEESSNKRIKTVISPKEKKSASPKATSKATPKAADKEAGAESPKASSPVASNPKKMKASAKRTIADDSEDEDVAEDESTKEQPKAKDIPNSDDKTSELEEKPAAEVIAQEESEMSEVFDEEPTRKKRGRKPSNPDGASKAKKTKTTSTKSKATKATAKGGKELTAAEEKIKSLQSWLVKCGIRKVWGRELSKFETSAEKISHLKSLLSDAGMTGQYSLAKAKKIKEDRELAAEVEAVQKGAAVWGESDDDGATRTRASRSGAAAGNGGGGTGRRLVQKSKGFEGLDFLDDQSDSD